MDEFIEELESKIDGIESKIEELNEKLDILDEINEKLEILDDIQCTVEDIPQDDILTAAYEAAEESAEELFEQLNKKTLLTILTQDKKHILPAYRFSVERTKKGEDKYSVYLYSRFHYREYVATYENKQEASLNLEVIFKAIAEGKKFYDASEDIFYDAPQNCVFSSVSNSLAITVLTKEKYQIVQVSSLRAYRHKKDKEEYCIGSENGNILFGLYPNKEEALAEMKNIFKAFIKGQNFYQIK